MTDDLRFDARIPGVSARARRGAAHEVRRATRSTPRGPSVYWTEELENIDYLIDASPLIVRKLRHHSFHITGIRPYDYRDKGDSRREFFEARMRELRALGGDGAARAPSRRRSAASATTIDGQLYNVDTLKFFEVLIGMERGGVLPAMRAHRSAGRLRDWRRLGRLRLPVQDASSRARPTSSSTFPSCSCSRRPTSARCSPMPGCCFGGTDGSQRSRRLARRRLRVRAARAGAPRVGAAAGSHRQHGVVPGDDRRAGARLRVHGRRRRVSAALQPQPRALAVQHRARQRQRGARRLVSPDRGAAARHRLHRAR